jgi:hypothetical protein
VAAEAMSTLLSAVIITTLQKLCLLSRLKNIDSSSNGAG